MPEVTETYYKPPPRPSEIELRARGGGGSGNQCGTGARRGRFCSRDNARDVAVLGTPGA